MESELRDRVVCLSRLSLYESWLRLSRSGIRSGLTARRWLRRGWKSGTVLCVQCFARKLHFLLAGMIQLRISPAIMDAPVVFSMNVHIGTYRIPNFLFSNSRHHPPSPDSPRTLVSQKGIYTARTEGTRGPRLGKKKRELSLMMAMPHALLESSSPASMLSLEKREGCFPRPLHSTTLHLWRLPLGKPWLSCCCPVRLAPHSPEANDPCQCAALAATPLFLDGLVPSLGFEVCFLPRVAIVRRERWGEEGGKPQSRQEHNRTAEVGKPVLAAEERKIQTRRRVPFPSSDPSSATLIS